jgi:hypothetical protein
MRRVGVARHGQEQPGCRNNKNPGREVMSNENATAVEVTNVSSASAASQATVATSFRDNALALVARQIPVIPILPHQKVTFLKNWPELATTNPGQVEAWNKQNPQYNCGAVAKLDGFWMLDCDAPSLQQTIEKETNQVFPQTFSVRSRRGLHFYFKHNDASRALKKNIQLKDEQDKVLCDVKVHNGYVVGPGSIHETGIRYEVVNDAGIIEAPDWLVTWIKQQHKHAECDEQKHSTSQAKIKEGGRDNFLFKQACRLRDMGLPKKDALTALLSINQTKCEPPLPEFIVGQKLESAFKGKPSTSTATVEEPVQKADVTPPPEVDGRALLCSLEEHFTRYAVLEKGLPLVLALWSLATHLFIGFDTFPYLAITSPTKRCGKTRTGELLEFVCANPESTVEISPAALFRLVDEMRPTLILDEAESLSGRGETTEALRAILNAGYRKGKKVRRSAKKSEDGTYNVEAFETFCPKVITLIGNLPDTLSDRCIPIRMKRRTSEILARFRFSTAQKEAAPVKEKMTTWAAANTNKVTDYYLNNDLLFISDREAELWLPLFSLLAVADPARLAELEITAMLLSDDKSANEPTERGIKLLADLRQIFAGTAGEAEQLTSQALLNSLRKIEESPWKDWGHGKGLSARNLAELLRPYEIRPQNVRAEKGKVSKAYKKDSFKDAWERYLPPIQATVAKPQTVTNAEPLDDPDASISVTRVAPADKADLEMATTIVSGAEFSPIASSLL